MLTFLMLGIVSKLCFLISRFPSYPIKLLLILYLQISIHYFELNTTILSLIEHTNCSANSNQDKELILKKQCNFD